MGRARGGLESQRGARPGPARPAKPRRRVGHRLGQRRLKRPAGRAGSGVGGPGPEAGGRGQDSALLTCWYRLPQAGSTAASAANANAMAQPAAGKEGERAS